MKKNKFLKFALRQPLKSLLLAVLIGVATFFLISRVVEYRIVTTETERIGSFYRSIGYFVGEEHHLSEWSMRRFGEDTLSDELSYGAGLVSQSPFFAYENRTERMFGILHDMLNTDISGVDYLTVWHDETEHEVRRALLLEHLGFDIGEARAEFDPADNPINNDAFIYFTPTRVFPVPLFAASAPWDTWSPYEYLMILGTVDTVKMGYPEHVAAGVEVEMRWKAEDGMMPELVANMEIGTRYFMRVSHHVPSNVTHIPFFNLTPEGNAPLYLKPIVEDALWFYPVAESEEVDFSSPELAHLSAMIEILNENQRTMSVAATVDMSALPVTQEELDMWFLHEGRWVDHDDYINKNHVAAVHWIFAQMRGLTIGDTITLTLRPMKTEDGEWIGWGEGIPFGFEGWRDLPTYEATFEIVGLFDRSRRDQINSVDTKDIFVPLSTVPADFGVEFNFFSHHLYSFVLTSTREQDAFITEYSDTLYELGIELGFIPHGAERFWESADSILQSLTFNAVLFVGVFLLVAAMVSFLYIQPNRRNFAILRALGCPAKSAVLKLCVPIVLIWPAFIVGGGIWGWMLAHEAAAEALMAIGELGEYIRGDASLHTAWLVGLCAVSFIIPLLIALFGALRIARRPVLELLQATAGKKVKQGVSDAPEESANTRHCGQACPELDSGRPTPIGFQITQGIAGQARNDGVLEPNDEALEAPGDGIGTKRNMKKAMRRHIWRQVVRSPLKSLLTVVIAILLLLAIGWLRGAIESGDEEIERLYDTTTVRAEVRRWLDDGADRYGLGQAIYANVVDDLMGSGYIQNVYLEAGLRHMHIILPNQDGGFPYELWEDVDALGSHNIHGLIATGDIDVFANAEQIEIVYMDGFDKTIFDTDAEYDFSTAVPIIMSERRMEEKGLSLGDMAFISFNFGNAEVSWTFPTQIVGTYIGNVRGMDFVAGGISVTPLASMDTIRGLLTRRYEHLASYITFRFEIDPARNREIEDFREILEGIVTRPRASWTHLTYEIFDGELELVVRQMEQNLRILYLLYPVAIVVSLLISAGLSVLLQFQNAKNAAVLRVLGAPKRRTRTMLVAGQAIVTLIGLVLGLVILVLAVDIGSDWLPLVLFKLGYLAAMLVGASVGAELVCKRSPLEMLQTRE